MFPEVPERFDPKVYRNAHPSATVFVGSSLQELVLPHAHCVGPLPSCAVDLFEVGSEAPEGRILRGFDLSLLLAYLFQQLATQKPFEQGILSVGAHQLTMLLVEGLSLEVGVLCQPVDGFVHPAVRWDLHAWPATKKGRLHVRYIVPAGE